MSDVHSDLHKTQMVTSAEHYVDWGAIIAGALVAFAVSSIFIAFGSAIGLSITSFQAGSSAYVIGLVIAAALWLLWIQVSSFMIGGYIAGRMRKRVGDGTKHEVEMRDGTHGLVVWALSVMLGIIVAGALTVSGLSKAATSPAPEYYVDKMLRGDVAPSIDANGTSGQIARIVAKSLGSSGIDAADNAYLVRQVMAQSAVPQPEAQIRVEQTIATLKAQADATRRFGILAAFLTAASLLVGAIGAWWAATIGGKHRNEGIDHSKLTGWR